MTFISTRGGCEPVSFREAVFKGLAPDGGLFVPDETPDLVAAFDRFGPETPFLEIASRMAGRLLAPEVSEETADSICRRAFDFSPILREVSDRHAILELFHGPSCAFKDFGASFLASFMEEYLRESDDSAVILTATSGDTGSAVARAFYGKRNLDVVVLYPSGRVSPLQEKQLTTLGGNIHALEVKGAFDDCQRLVKQAFVDGNLTGKVRLTSANSINLGRLFPQSFYYVWAWAQARGDLTGDGSRLTFCVPSGNFGNLTAGVYAWNWGLPLSGFLAATNANDVVPEYLQTGVFSPRDSVHTYSNAMDVGNPSNFERLLSIFEERGEEMKTLVRGDMVTDARTLEVIASYRQDAGAFLDPHTAVGYEVAERFLRGDPESTVITLSTAHPGKFLEVVEEATGTRPPLPARLAEVLNLPKQVVEIDRTPAALAEFLLERFA
jgi:threonine synthase